MFIVHEPTSSKMAIFLAYFNIFKFSLCLVIISTCLCSTKKPKNEKIGKKVTDYTDADLQKLLDQWNDNDSEFEDEDEDDPRFKEQPKIDMQDVLKGSNSQEDIIKKTKKGVPMMIFANVAGNPTRQQTDTVSGIWQTSLRNNQIQAQRYIVADNRVLFQLEDGSQAVEIKDYLVTLDTCESVSFENMEFPGKGAGRTKLEL